MTNKLERFAFSAREVADSLGCSEKHIKNLMASGELASVKLGARRLVLVEDLKALLESRRRSQPVIHANDQRADASSFASRVKAVIVQDLKGNGPLAKAIESIMSERIPLYEDSGAILPESARLK